MAEKITTVYDLEQRIKIAKAKLAEGKKNKLTASDLKLLSKAVKDAETALRAVKKALEDSRKR